MTAFEITGVSILLYLGSCCTGFVFFIEDEKADRITGRQLLALTILSPITVPLAMAAMAWLLFRTLYQLCKPPVSAVMIFSLGSPMDAWSGLRAVIRSILRDRTQH